MCDRQDLLNVVLTTITCGQFNYKDADELVNFCTEHKIPMRGHCIFLEVECNCQDWLKTLTPTELADALQNRAIELLSRYKGKFKHYDVNNEMLHGCFFRDRLSPTSDPQERSLPFPNPQLVITDGIEE